jgi:integrase/recombinase XerD
MANREVNLTKRIQTPHGMRYCRVVLSANGRVKPDVVIVDCKPETHKEGAYYLEWREGAKRVRLSVGKDPTDASARRQRKEAELNAVNNGVSVVPDGQNGHRSVAAAVADYLDETKLTKKSKTHAAYSTALAYFVESCHKLNLEEIDRKDLLKFHAFLRDVMSFLKANGIRGLVGKNDWPRFTEEEPEIYEKEELDKLFAKCDPEERLWYEFFLMTGMREQEVMYTYWSDINLSTRQRQLLVAQVQGDVRDLVTLGRGRSADCAAVARSLRHGEHDAVPEAFAQSACTGQGK